MRVQTPRLLVRCWSQADAPLLREAIDSSLDHLQAWLPWAFAEPRTLEETRALLQGFEAAFRKGEDFVYGVFSPDESRVIGGSGLHPRIGPGGLEIGYWIRLDETRRGYATEVSRALTTAGLEIPGMERIEIHCDPGNVVSRRVPERLGFELREVRAGDTTDVDGSLGDTLVFVMSRTKWARGSAGEVGSGERTS